MSLSPEDALDYIRKNNVAYYELIIKCVPLARQGNKAAIRHIQNFAYTYHFGTGYAVEDIVETIAKALVG